MHNREVLPGQGSSGHTEPGDAAYRRRHGRRCTRAGQWLLPSPQPAPAREAIWCAGLLHPAQCNREKDARPQQMLPCGPSYTSNRSCSLCASRSSQAPFALHSSRTCFICRSTSAVGPSTSKNVCARDTGTAIAEKKSRQLPDLGWLNRSMRSGCSGSGSLRTLPNREHKIGGTHH
jgi:hypothetical protein